MGRATIVSGGTDGLYTVSIDVGTELRDVRIATLEIRQDALTAQIAAQEAIISGLVAGEFAVRVALNAAISTYNASQKTPEDKAALSLAVDNRNQTTKSRQAAVTKMARLTADLANVESELSALDGLDLTDTIEAWCADFSEEASGEVATIEINGEGRNIIIAPGGELSPEVPGYTDADGYLSARAVMSGPQAYFNAAILPGWQKWRPTYRLAVIDAIDYETDTADITIDDAISSAQNLDINQDATIESVPIEYMTCNSVAFEVNDRVVVQFDGQDWSSPKVIGFESNPKQCSQIYVHRAYSGTGIGAGTWMYGLFSIPGIWDAYNASPSNVEIWSRNSGGDTETYPWGKATHGSGTYALASTTGGLLWVYEDNSFYQGNPTYDDFADPQMPLVEDIIYIDFTWAGMTGAPEIYIKINNQFSSLFRCDLGYSPTIAGAKMDQQWFDVEPSSGAFMAIDVTLQSWDFSGLPEDP